MSVTPFRPKGGVVGNGIVIDPDQILENAKGHFREVVVCGFNEDGSIDVRSSHGARDAAWILAQAQNVVLFESGDG